MDTLPQTPAILVSTINMLLRDKEYDSLEDLCRSFDREEEEIKAYLMKSGYEYSEEQRQMRPVGYNQ
jgi:hypothetical protein